MNATSYLLVGAVIGLLPAVIAHRKGGNFLYWWVFGALLFIVALPMSVLASTNTRVLEARQRSGGMKKCPRCAEMVKQEARVCRFCGSDIAHHNSGEGTSDLGDAGQVHTHEWESGEIVVLPSPAGAAGATARFQVRAWGPDSDWTEAVSAPFEWRGAARPSAEEAAALKSLVAQLTVAGWEPLAQVRGDAWHRRSFRRRLAMPVLADIHS